MTEERDRPDEEIEVTREMRRAGAMELMTDISLSNPEDLAEDAFRAMWRARRVTVAREET